MQIKKMTLYFIILSIVVTPVSYTYASEEFSEKEKQEIEQLMAEKEKSRYSQHLSIFYGKEDWSFYGPKQEDKSNLILMAYDIETHINQYVSYSHILNMGSLRDEVYSAETFGYLVAINLTAHNLALSGGIGVSYLVMPDKLTHLADSPLYANFKVGISYDITESFSINYDIIHYSSPFTTKDGGKNYGCLSAKVSF